MDISGWLKRNSKDDDSWKGRRAIPDDAVIFNASDGPKLSTFIGELRHFTKFPSSTYSGPSVDYLERFILERTTLTSDHARQLESISAAHLVLSNCEITDDVAKSLAKIKVIQSLTFDQLHISEQALMSFGAIDCYSLTLKQLRISNQSLSALLANPKLLHSSNDHGNRCSAAGLVQENEGQHVHIALRRGLNDNQPSTPLATVLEQVTWGSGVLIKI